MPDIAKLFRKIVRELTPGKPFDSSASYWEDRYRAGGKSGSGSYDKLAEFKAEIINGFVKAKGIRTVIEFGCGDGNQLTYGEYESYLGFDVSPEAVSMCRKRFSDDNSKTFKITPEYSNESAELTLSLDVIYHLVEDDVFELYMAMLFKSASKYVIIYSSNSEGGNTMDHVRHRLFTNFVAKNFPGWQLSETVPDRYPSLKTSPSDSIPSFYIYERNSQFEKLPENIQLDDPTKEHR